MGSASGSAQNVEPPARTPLQPHGVALAQSVLYVAAGVWPLVHMRSFEAATGPQARALAGSHLSCGPIRAGEARTRLNQRLARRSERVVWRFS